VTTRKERAAARAAAKQKLAKAKQKRRALQWQLFELGHDIAALQRAYNEFLPVKKRDAYGFTTDQHLDGTESEAAAYRANRWMMG
jgi:hypothetical protein